MKLKTVSGSLLIFIWLHRKIQKTGVYRPEDDSFKFAQQFFSISLYCYTQADFV
jgi:hypothetical protein